MGIVMAGIDHSRASVAEREPFSLAGDRAAELSARIRGREGVSGCVLISTCNRTELYISGDEALCPAHILCDELAVPGSAHALFTVRRGRHALLHLMLLASGLRSRVRGEDQVLGQVKAAIQTAHEQGCADSVLQTAFRLAVSAGKRVKTEVQISPVETSSAHSAVEALSAASGGLAGLRALVIGNGEMGRLAASLLVGHGCEVMMTLRSYRHGTVPVPDGLIAVPYDERYNVIPGCDIVVSATASPHFTLGADKLRELPVLPRYLVDLAVPRDIDPGAAELAGVRYWNVDTLYGGKPDGETVDKLRAAMAIIDAHMLRFDKWKTWKDNAQLTVVH